MHGVKKVKRPATNAGIARAAIDDSINFSMTEMGSMEIETKAKDGNNKESEFHRINLELTIRMLALLFSASLLATSVLSYVL